jgi:hypothetical protein
MDGKLAIIANLFKSGFHLSAISPSRKRVRA